MVCSDCDQTCFYKFIFDYVTWIYIFEPLKKSKNTVRIIKGRMFSKITQKKYSVEKRYNSIFVNTRSASLEKHHKMRKYFSAKWQKNSVLSEVTTMGFGDREITGR